MIFPEKENIGTGVRKSGISGRDECRYYNVWSMMKRYDVFRISACAKLKMWSEYILRLCETKAVVRMRILVFRLCATKAVARSWWNDIVRVFL